MSKRAVVNFVLVFLLVFSLYSCKKCVTCTYTNDIGQEMTAESCRKKANEELESDLNDQWGKYGPVTCK